MKKSTFTLNGNLKYSESTLKIAKMWGCFENPFANDNSLDPTPLPSVHMRRRCSALSVTVGSHTFSLSGGGEKLLAIHSLKWFPNDVLTTCKAISKGLASGFVYWSCALRQNHRSTVLSKNKNMAVQGGTVSHYYSLVIRKFFDFMSLFRHSVWSSFSVKQFLFAEFGICNI